MSNALSIRELQVTDIPCFADYWLKSDPIYLQSLGVDLVKLPSRSEWEALLTEQLNTPLAEKKIYCLIWEVDGQAVGHTNLNQIQPGKQAHMHLHLWDPTIRQRGYGRALVQLALPLFFDTYHIQHLYCEPYALNSAPNRALAKLGFTFVKEYITTPGSSNFEQPVNQWVLSQNQFRLLQG